MTKFRALIIVVVLSVVLLFLHTAALAHSWYWIFPWLDYVVHSLGGATVGLLSIVVFATKKEHDQRYYATVALFGALLLSFVWEYIEYKIGLTFAPTAYPLDTISDVLAGIIAAVGVSHLVYPIR
jgi:hypothetical protein